jgi:hypothetical protein
MAMDDSRGTQQTFHQCVRDGIGYAVFTGAVDNRICYGANLPRLMAMAEKIIVDLTRVTDVALPVDFRDCLAAMRRPGKQVILCVSTAIEDLLQLDALDEPFDICLNQDDAEALLKEGKLALVA